MVFAPALVVICETSVLAFMVTLSLLRRGWWENGPHLMAVFGGVGTVVSSICPMSWQLHGAKIVAAAETLTGPADPLAVEGVGLFFAEVDEFLVFLHLTRVDVLSLFDDMSLIVQMVPNGHLLNARL